jgi:hypothetical protein
MLHDQGRGMLEAAQQLTEEEKQEPELAGTLLSPEEAKGQFLAAHRRASEASGEAPPA